MVCISRNVEGIPILDLQGEIDLYKSPEVRSEIGKFITKKSKVVAINFQQVTYIDSSGLATMIDAFQKMRGYGGQLVLFALTKSVRSVFEVARLDKFFSIYEEEIVALKSLRNSSPPSA